jgi:hypothetical protein
MISSKNIPVLIDFGFAERYDPTGKEPFISNLHYGTPEVRVIFLIFQHIHLCYLSILHRRELVASLMTHGRPTYGRLA